LAASEANPLYRSGRVFLFDCCRNAAGSGGRTQRLVQKRLISALPLNNFARSFVPAYAASKGGIVQFTRSCAVAWARDNIQANAVLPGWIDTDLTRRARKEIDGLHDKVLARTPAARWGAIADFAGIAVFLSSAASDFVTGTAIPVDGGFSVMG
jgi:NAD(P)-dependent dehydrogenase (short-subunit alcohol dehydrogenase family)